MGIHCVACYVDQVSPVLRDLPDSVFSVLGLKVFTTMPHMVYFLRHDLMQFKLVKL